MKVRVPVVVQDPHTARFEGVPVTEGWDIEGDEVFLDGPVTDRLAVIDFDPDTQAVTPGVAFEPPGAIRKMGRYAVVDEDDMNAGDALKVCLFGTVRKTMSMFETPDVLGRRVTWGFDAPQLLLVPRAGQWANAFYERDSHSIQFFSFDSGGATINTALSRDIVAHETGHAIVDGLAPDLYNALSPQSLALHEAMADMSAAMMAFRSHNLRAAVLARTDGSIEDTTAFASIAEEFGLALGRPGSLRNLSNEYSLDPASPHCVPHDEPHELSGVLSGALYAVVTRLHGRLTDEYAAGGMERPAAAGKALGVAEQRVTRMFFRALDYLPAGEVSFADYGRALLAADQASHPDHDQERRWLQDELVRRAVVTSASDLDVDTNFEEASVKGIDLGLLVDSDWAAYGWVGARRALFGIPEDVPFKVHPRRDATKLFYHRDGPQRVRECIIKVSWDQPEPNELGAGLPEQRSVTVGTTLAIDWFTKLIRCRLVSGAAGGGGGPAAAQERAAGRAERTALLKAMLQSGSLELGRRAQGLEGMARPSIVGAANSNGVMRLNGTARMLHLAQGVT